MKYQNENKGFTLSEVLIALTVIGIIAAITIPVMQKSFKWKQYRSGTLKAMSLLDQVSIKYNITEGVTPDCAYWKNNPYGAAKCAEYNSTGSCIRYILKDSGDPLPSDYNGNFTDCRKLYSSFLENMNIAKTCTTNAYANGCIPKYGGNDTIYKANNPDASDFDTNKANSGCAGFNQSVILSGPAFITADGMIFFPYGGSPSARIMAVDINGFKKPNKWGHDIRVFSPKMTDSGYSPRFEPGGCEIIEKGGISTKTLLYSK